MDHLCECGCGEKVKWSKQNKRWNKYVLYHGNRGDQYKHRHTLPKLCECGCGEYAKHGYKVIFGHHNRTERYWKIQEGPKLCECGCGNYATAGRRFISGHNKGNFKKTKQDELKLCACGCGEYAKSGNKYIYNHHWQGKTHSQKTREKIAKINSNPSSETKIRLKEAAIQRELKRSIKLGLTQSKYCDAWEDKEYRNDLRKGACEECGITNMMCIKISGMQLSTHHTNGKKNCAPWEIATLCTSCHMRLESKFRERGYSSRFM